jgi:hypothetical protein
MGPECAKDAAEVLDIIEGMVAKERARGFGKLNKQENGNG